MIARLLIFIVRFYWVIPGLTVAQMVLTFTGHMSWWWLLLWVPLSLVSLIIKWLTEDADQWR